ncbi:hypothetical protein HYU18_04475 [Candidatus Woesearchaeota archaeon]|nr:hypothetical protein [Candidatus Woesearchaeota archaeon]
MHWGCSTFPWKMEVPMSLSLKQILELAERESYSTREIEEIIVGEKALCGRTAFYDYFKELKHKKMIRQAERGAKKVIVPEKAAEEEVR